MTEFPKTLLAIPARESSARLPGKLLADVGGRPLIAWTVERGLECAAFADIAVVTDSDAIANVVQERFSDRGVRVIHDSRPSANGTIRIARAVERIAANRAEPRYQVVVNHQADEVMLSADDVRAAILHHVATNPDGVTTLVAPLSKADPANPNTVKAACQYGRAYWFARGKHGADGSGGAGGWQRHVGVYVFSTDTIRRIGGLFVHPTAIEAELEQLTWVCAGFPFAVVRAERATLSVNAAEDLEKFRGMVARERGKDGR